MTAAEELALLRRELDEKTAECEAILQTLECLAKDPRAAFVTADVILKIAVAAFRKGDHRGLVLAATKVTHD